MKFSATIDVKVINIETRSWS